MKIAIVILNYINYKETIKCVNSILENNIECEGIVIVDNASNNDSYILLRKIYRNEQSIHIIRSKRNVGFARGNNIGIVYARKTMETDFVLLINSDTMIIEADFMEKLLSKYKEGVGLITSALRFYGGQGQDELLRDDLSLKGRIIDYFTMLLEYWYYPVKHRIVADKCKTERANGCVMLLTADYFKYYNYLYPYTFLYYEEVILSMMLHKVGLSLAYAADAKIFHADHKSSDLCFQQESRKMKFYRLQSMKHTIYVKLLPYCFLKRLI